MSFFLFMKQIVDMLYQYKFLDYIMVGLILIMLIYQMALVRPDLKKWYVPTDIIVLVLSAWVTFSFSKDVSCYETYFKIISAFLMYFVGRIYYERIQECYGALVSSAYIVIYLNFFYRLYRFGTKFMQVSNAGGDYYYYDTDMAFGMVVAMVFIAMFAKNTVWRLFTMFVISPYMVFCSDAGIQKVLMLVVYAIITVYILELIFRKKTISNMILVTMIVGIIAVVVMLYLPVFGFENMEVILNLFRGKLLDSNNMYIRYNSWEIALREIGSQGFIGQWFGISLNPGYNISSLYIKILYSLGYLGLVLVGTLIGCITYYVSKVEDRKTFYMLVILIILLLGSGITMNSMEYVQMSWFPFLFAGMVVSSISDNKNKI